MHGDFTLDPLHYREGVSRVLIQQGRVQLDSDFNEHTESLLRFLRGMGRDLIGPHGGPNDSFMITTGGTTPSDLQIARGEYYVDGIRCLLPADGDIWEMIGDPSKNDGRKPVPLSKLANYVPPSKADIDKTLLFYIDVFERHISSSEDDSLREIALLGADTASRAVITWRIRTLLVDQDMQKQAEVDFGWPFRKIDGWYVVLNALLRTGIRMRADAIGSESTNPCAIAPAAGYRGVENRLFRVEIHDGGDVTAKPPRKPTIKWSEDNGTVVYPVRRVDGKTVHLDTLGRDARTQICVNDWVEIVDDDVVLNPIFRPLLQVIEVKPAEMAVILSGDSGGVGSDPARHPILRRWASDLIEVDLVTPIDLSDGVQVRFSRVAFPRAGFRPGDYWLIPTRTAQGEIVWPAGDSGSLDLPPNGVDHHYAPLMLRRADGATAKVTTDLRRTFEYLGVPPPTPPTPAPNGGINNLPATPLTT